MKAHKVPATYYSGWEISALPDRMYVFYKNDTSKQGICKRFRDVNKITTEHSFFMEENFYYIDFSINGIAFKLENEITNFLKDKGFIIKCIDDLSKTTPSAKILIDDYSKFMSYQSKIDSWEITDSNGNFISNSEFKTILNNYIFNNIGTLIEENYFANYLEYMWPEIRSSIKSNIQNLNSKFNDVGDKTSQVLGDLRFFRHLRVCKTPYTLAHTALLYIGIPDFDEKRLFLTAFWV